MKLFGLKERPWPPDIGMTTEKWKQIRPSLLLLEALRCSQDTLDIAALLDYPTESYCDDEFVHVIAYDGQLWIEDGHHRAIKSHIRGEKAIWARVLDLETEKVTE